MLLKNIDSSMKSEDCYKALEIERCTVEYVDNSKRFYDVSRDFSKQYAHIYSARLAAYRNILLPAIKKKWPNCKKVLKLCDLRDRNTCIIIGTLFKLQQLKPSILKELSDQLEIIPQPARNHFVHDEDSIVLEDELQRIKLSGDSVKVHHVVTGVVCALLGSEDEDGVFSVEDVCWADCNIQKPLPILNDDRYIVLLCGLNMASKSADHMFSIQLLLEWLAGVSGTNEYQEQMSKVVRIIIAGGVFTNYANNSILSEEDIIASAESVDAFCSTLSSLAPLDIMPGCKDPADVMLPQKPFHYCLFPKATEYKLFNRVSNPYECDIGGFTCLGSSGESIRDIQRYSKLESSLEIMKKTLQWRHLAPTCPDTIPCTPCDLTDPFIIYNCPAIYFSGNCDEFATDIYKGGEGQQVRLVCLPDFCDSKTVALVNLANLECHSVTFT